MIESLLAHSFDICAASRSGKPLLTPIGYLTPASRGASAPQPSSCGLHSPETHTYMNLRTKIIACALALVFTVLCFHQSSVVNSQSILTEGFEA